MHGVEGDERGDQLAALSQTVLQLSALFDTVSQSLAEAEARAPIVESRLLSIEERQNEAARLLSWIRDELSAVEAGVYAAQSDVAGLHIALEQKAAAWRPSASMPAAAEPSTVVRNDMRTELNEYAAAVANELSAIREEMQACREQLATVNESSAKVGDLRAVQADVEALSKRISEIDQLGELPAKLRGKVEEVAAAADARMGQYVVEISADLHKRVGESARIIEGELHELVGAWRIDTAQTKEEFRLDFEQEVQSMKEALELELSTSQNELSFMLNSWQEGLASVALTLATRLQGGKPWMAPEAADRALEALTGVSAALGSQLGQLRNVTGNVAGGQRPAAMSECGPMVPPRSHSRSTSRPPNGRRALQLWV